MANDSTPRAETGSPPVDIRVVGLGGAGVTLAERLAALGFAGAGFWAVDSDAQALSRCALARAMTLGMRDRRGLGCGSDPALGRQCAEAQAGDMAQLVEGADLVLVLAGLGGGLGTGAAPVMARQARSAGALVIGMVTMPFDFQGKRCGDQARAGLDAMRSVADAVLVLPNQGVNGLCGEDATAMETFERANRMVLGCLAGLGRMLRGGGLLPAGVAELDHAMRGGHATWALVEASVQGRGRAGRLAKELLEHPFLEDGSDLRDAPAMVAVLLGGPDLKMAEVDQVMKDLHQACPRTRAVVGAHVEEAAKGTLSAVMMVSRPAPVSPPVAEEPVVLPPAPLLVEDSPKPRRGKRKRKTSSPEQQQLALQLVTKGRFEKSEPNLHEGVDLDIPTFLRRNMVLN